MLSGRRYRTGGESQVRIGVFIAVRAGKLETGLEAGDYHRWPVEHFGYVGEGVGGGMHDYYLIIVSK